MTSLDSSSFKKGIQQGNQEGLQKGIQEGIQKGIQKGLIEGLKLFIKNIVVTKFNKESIPFFNKIDSIDDINKLKKIRRKVKNANSFDEIKNSIDLDSI